MYALLLTWAIGLLSPPCDPICPPDADPTLCQAWPPCQIQLLPDLPETADPAEQVCAIGRDGPVCHLP